jgi:hypothetical protein
MYVLFSAHALQLETPLRKALTSNGLVSKIVRHLVLSDMAIYVCSVSVGIHFSLMGHGRVKPNIAAMAIISQQQAQEQQQHHFLCNSTSQVSLLGAS